jgi:Sec-independent protein secretion pathway component TatC
MIKYLIEFKNRLFFLVLLYLSTSIVLYLYKEILLFLLVQSKWEITNDKSSVYYFIFTDVTEIFSVYIQLILFITFQLLVLFSIYHSFIFFIPALFKKEYEYFKVIIMVILFTWFFSVLISNYYIIPFSWDFFLSFQNFITDKSFNIHFEAKLSEYFAFYISFYYICFFYLQFSVVIFFCFQHFNQELKNIKKFRKLYYFCFVLVATFLCPDFLTQLLLSIVLIFMYEFLLLIFLLNYYKKIS